MNQSQQQAMQPPACAHETHAHKHEHVHGPQCQHDHGPDRASAPLLSLAEINERLEDLPGWRLDETHLVKSFHFEQPKEAAAFVEFINRVAEERNHHPHVIFWKRDVTLKLWTHKSNGLTENDFKLAALFDPQLEVYA
jgi:4a-hydroxytetrahydrobiopterin dehydratase